VREQVALAPDQSGTALTSLLADDGPRHAASLSTCNRTELYVDGEPSSGDAATNWLSRFRRLPDSRLTPYIYRYQDEAAVRHVLRVATGLDSLVLGEPQILGQLKTAWKQARQAGALCPELERLFQRSFAVAKRVRSGTEIGANPVSVAYAAVRLARQIYENLADCTVMLIGAGDTMELVARHLREHGCTRLVVANRSLDRAQGLAERFSGYAVALDALPTHLAEADIIISSTASPEPILKRPMLEEALRNRRRRPVFIVDLAVPRDVEPAVAELDDIFLYTIDDLRDVIEHGLRLRREAAEEAEQMIELEVGHFMEWLRGQEAVPAIRRYRAMAEEQRDQVLERARAMLERGEPPERALDYLAHNLTRRLMHPPTVRLRTAAERSRIDLLTAAEDLLGLEPREDDGDAEEEPRE
jgi:glutamyl-tRNA reductase